MGGVRSAIAYVYMLLIWAQLDGNDTAFKNFDRFRGVFGGESAASRVNVGLGKDTRKRPSGTWRGVSGSSSRSPTQLDFGLVVK